MKPHTLTHISYLQGHVENIDNEKLAHLCITTGARSTEDPLENRFEDSAIPSNEEWDKVFESIQYQYRQINQEELELVDYWAQLHRKYESTNKHNHFNTNEFSNQPSMAAVYYVQIPKGAGKLVFEYNINQYQTKTHSIEPAVGNFFIFPSTIDHYVTKNLSNDLRISISFNAKVKNSK